MRSATSPSVARGPCSFFHLMSYERAATVLTSNKGFEEWGEVFGDDVMAGALIDRLVHHCHIVNIRGNSYRMRTHSELQPLLRPSPPPPPPPPRPPRRQAAPTPPARPPPPRVPFSPPPLSHSQPPLPSRCRRPP